MEALGDKKTDWLSFLGASYFKALGQTRQFGLSARGLAIDVGTNPEEFPLFKAFWLEPRTEGGGIVVNALLDSPSITGAYRMEAIRGDGVTMIVDARLFPRRDDRADRHRAAHQHVLVWEAQSQNGLRLAA